jgi:hypothetical protein
MFELTRECVPQNRRFDSAGNLTEKGSFGGKEGPFVYKGLLMAQ